LQNAHARAIGFRVGRSSGDFFSATGAGEGCSTSWKRVTLGGPNMRSASRSTAGGGGAGAAAAGAPGCSNAAISDCARGLERLLVLALPLHHPLHARRGNPVQIPMREIELRRRPKLRAR
jgi:hypothetical protein